ncbi:MAG: Na/Pi cotransporter family protein [Planctomycetota bacterium]
MRRGKRPFFFIAALLLSPVLFGCGREKATTPYKIQILGPSVMAGALSKDLDLPLRFLVTGRKETTALGGSWTPPATNVRVAFELSEEPPEGQARLGQTETRTDAGGMASLRFFVGLRPGIYKIRARLPDCPSVAPVVVTVLGGVVVSGDHQDGWVDTALEHPLSVRIERAPGVHEQGAAVRFDLRSATKGTRLSLADAVTDEDGMASVLVQLGSEQGSNEIGIQFLTSALGAKASYQTLIARCFAINRWGLLVSLFGGLAIFILGMKLMSQGLQLIAGDKLKALLNLLTRNRFAAVGVGLGVTGLIQSSSACTVMLIGFINAGLMRLEQAIAVIMGSNIGTTVTAQMVSFKLDDIALPAVAVGVAMTLLARRSHTRFLGEVLIGFGLLFLGMMMMGSPLKGLKDSLWARTFFEGLSCTPLADGTIPLGGMVKAILAGTALTMIVQSSSATIGLLLVIAAAGLVDVYTAFAVLLGCNIGTTVTAVLASIGSSLSAKRAACAHVLFNVAGTFIMIFFFYLPYPKTHRPVFLELVNFITPGNAFEGENIQRFLANAHTLFNVACAAVFIWFVAFIAKTCRTFLPGSEPTEESAFRMLDPRLLSIPSLALQQAWFELGLMLEKSRNAHREGFRAIVDAMDPDWERLASSVRTQEIETDELQSAITQYLRTISMEKLTEEQSNQIPHLIHSVNDAERIGDHSVHLIRLARRVRKRNLPFSEVALAHMREMFRTVESLFDTAASLLNRHAAEPGPGVDRPAEARLAGQMLEKQEHDYRKAHVARQEAGGIDIRSGVVFLDVLLNLNRVGAHLVNIIEAASTSSKGPR